MACIICQSGTCWHHIFVVEEHMDDVPIAGPGLSGRRCLVYLPHGPRGPHSGVADHMINWNPRLHNKIIDQGLRGHKDRTETSSVMS